MAPSSAETTDFRSVYAGWMARFDWSGGRARKDRLFLRGC
jgi:hypothetical protein